MKILNYINNKIKIKMFEVQSGTMRVLINARTPYAAAKKSIKKYNPKSLGRIISCTEIKKLQTEDDVYYISTERILEELGHTIIK